MNWYHILWEEITNLKVFVAVFVLLPQKYHTCSLNFIFTNSVLFHEQDRHPNRILQTMVNFFPIFGVFVVTECSFTQLLQFYVRSKLAILGKFRFINYGSYLVGDDLTHRRFYKLAEIGNIGVRGFTIYVKINKSATEVLPPKED